MTQWTHTIGRQITNAIPTWRAAMSATNTLYEIGDLPSVAESRIVWPSAGAENALYTGTDGNYAYMHYGYGSSLYLHDVGGAHGSMLFGYTGEATFSEQMTVFTLSDNTPTWNFFQQPNYAVSSAEAVSMDADWYYSPADYAALAASKKIPRGAGEDTWSGGWDGTFPVGYANWVMRRKIQTSFLGNNRPHFFRYQMPRYIPAAMTGTGSGAVVVTNLGTIYGPFSQGPLPPGVTADQWYADTWSSTSRKNYLWSMNVTTKVWTRLTNPLPQLSSQGTIMLPQSAVDEANKRVYYWVVNGGNNALIYADFSSGQGAMAFTGPTNMTDLAGSPQPAEDANNVLCVPTSGALAGKRLWFLKNTIGQLLLIDIDNNTIRTLTPSGMPSGSAWWMFSYDATINRVYITIQAGSAITNYRFTIPTDYTNSAAYTVTSQNISLNGIALEHTNAPWQYGERNRYIPTLGVIMLTQRFNKMIAFRPQ